MKLNPETVEMLYRACLQAKGFLEGAYAVSNSHPEPAFMDCLTNLNQAIYKAEKETGGCTIDET